MRLGLKKVIALITLRSNIRNYRRGLDSGKESMRINARASLYILLMELLYLFSMNKPTSYTYATIFGIFFLSVILNYGFASLISSPHEGDSLAYHIPIAQSVLTGSILHPTFYLGYYPSTAEVILSLFLLLHIPLNLFNIFCLILLFFSLKKLAERVGLDTYMAVIFSVSVCLLPTMLRWSASQVIDIWLLLFYIVCVTLLENPDKRYRYFFFLGCAAGLLIGAKFSGPLFALGLCFIYYKKFVELFSFKRLLFFLIPFVIIGLSWYLRNTLIMHNPIYPQRLFSLPGFGSWNIFAFHEWQIIIQYPLKIVNALIAEYFFWFLSPLAALSILIFQRNTLGKFAGSYTRLLLLGIYNLFIFLFLPTTPEYNIIVSSLRYSYPAFVPFILCSYLAARALKQELTIILLSFSGLLFLPGSGYRPKLLFIFILLLFVFRYGKKSIISR